MAKPTVLAFGLTGARLDALRCCCLPLSIAVISVPAGDLSQPLGALLGLMPRSAPSATAPIGEMLVMAAFDDALLDRFLAALKALPSFPLKAMLTPMNVMWSGARLYAELTKEHQRMQSASPKA